MSALAIDQQRLMRWIGAFGKIGALPGGGVCRLALSDADKEGRDLLVGHMRSLDLAVSIDAIGNIWGVPRRAARFDMRFIFSHSRCDHPTDSACGHSDP